MLPAPTRQLIREAGPPNSWQGAAVVGALVVGAMVASLPGAGVVVPAAIALAIATIPAIVDIDGWRIRLAMAWLAAEQRRRISPGMPRTPAAADRWLAANPDAPPLVHAFVLMLAGRPSEARPPAESAPMTTAEERASRARTLYAIDALTTGTADPGAALLAIDELPMNGRPYHRLSLAWSLAWVERANDRPWRGRFAAASRGIGWSEIPRTWLVLLAAQQLLLPICIAAVFVVWALIMISR